MINPMPHTMRALHLRYDGPIPQHMRPDYRERIQARRIGNIMTMLRMADDYRRAALEARTPEIADRMRDNADEAYAEMTQLSKQYGDA